jgi:hypothetical protein
MGIQRRKAFERFIASWDPFNSENLLSSRAPNCTQEYYPPPAGRKPWTNADAKEFYDSMVDILKGNRLVVHDFVEDDSSNRILCHLTSHVSFHQSEVENYVGDYVFIVTFDEAQEKVSKIEEWVDSNSTPRFVEQINKAKALLGKDGIAKPTHHPDQN